MGFLVFVDWVSARWFAMFSMFFQMRCCSFHSWINPFHICIEMILDVCGEPHYEGEHTCSNHDGRI